MMPAEVFAKKNNVFAKHHTGWLIAAACAAILAALACQPAVRDALLGAYKALLPLHWRKAIWVFRYDLPHTYLEVPIKIYSNPFTYAVVLLVFLLERVIPARREQRVFSVGLAQDFVWFNADCIFRMFWIGMFVNLLHQFYNQHLGFLTIQEVASWSLPVRWAWSFVWFDLLNWVHHYIRHRVEVLWYFHMVHHSQRKLNLFTDSRVHLLEYFVTRCIIFIPLFMLQIDRGAVVWLAVVLDWYARVYHANLRTNYGPLKYILVTPQSHRIHHSRNPEHVDKNFGLFLTVWDRLFGTLHANYDEYPETGIQEEFPLEDMVVGLDVLKIYIQQMLYPFGLLARRLFKGMRVAA